jgi:hypothetical protein
MRNLAIGAIFAIFDVWAVVRVFVIACPPFNPPSWPNTDAGFSRRLEKGGGDVDLSLYHRPAVQQELRPPVFHFFLTFHCYGVL